MRITKINQLNLNNIIKYKIIQTSLWSGKININTKLEKYEKSETDSKIFLGVFKYIKTNLW